MSMRRESSKPEVHVEPGHACRVRWDDTYVAYYSPAVVKNGWEPYDQPATAAYLPFAFSACLNVRCGGGLVLVRRRGRTSLPSGASIFVRAAFAGVGAPPKAADLALKLLTGRGKMKT